MASGSGAADNAVLLHVADYLQPIEDRDCSLELVLPAAAEQERAVVVLGAASQLLKVFSEKFRRVAHA